MLSYILQRVLWAIPTLIVISIVTFVIIQLPPGDYVTAYVAQLSETGETVDEATVAILRERFGLNKPLYEQYWTWISDIVFRGDFGQSLEWNIPVADLIWQRVGLTILISFIAMIVTWLIAIPIGVFSATHQYTVFDYLFTVIGFIGRGIPNFLLALVILWLAFSYLGMNVGGSFPPNTSTHPGACASL